nr:hypothetical protein [Tanacetum cinerariifolium]
MSTQQYIYVAGSENRPHILNKDNYVPWSSRIIRYARSRPNGKMIVDSIKNGPYVRRMIATPGELDLFVPVPETFHEQIDKELTENDIKRIDADDQAIQTILLGLPEDVYAVVDSCETAKEIWERIQQMIKGSDIEEQQKKAKLFNEWEKFTSTDGESIESYYHHFMQLMNDLKRNKHFPENIAVNIKTSSNPRNRQIAQPGMNMSQDRQSQNIGGNGRNQFGQYAGQVAQNQQGYNAWQNGGIQVAQNAVQNLGVHNGGNQNRLVVVPGIANQNGTGNIVAARAEEEFDFMTIACDLDEIEEFNANCILMANLQHASTSGTQLDKAPVYDTDSSIEVQLNDNCYDNDIFNMFTQEEQYTDLLEPIPEPRLVPQNDNHVTSVTLSMVQSGGTVETSYAPNKETHAHQETIYRNLIDQVAQEDKYLDKEVNLEAKIKDLENILLKKDQTVQTMHMLNPKPDSFYHPDHKMALVSKTISVPNEDLSDDTTPSVARKFLNKVKNSLVTLQRVVKQKMTLDVHNWSSSAHKEVHKIISHEIAPIINQVNVMVQNFEIQFLKEAAKFVRDFKSLGKESDESLDKQKSSELEIERLLKASVSHDIMSIVPNGFVDVSSDLQTELDRTKEKLKHCIIKKEKEYVVLWNNWYTKCEECKYDKISYDKAYNDMKQKIERLQAQLGDLKGKSNDTPSASNTFDPLNQKLETKIVELEF